MIEIDKFRQNVVIRDVKFNKTIMMVSLDFFKKIKV